MSESQLTVAERRAMAEQARRHQEVEAEFLRGLMGRLPQNLEVVEQLAQLYTEMGRFQEGLELDRHIVSAKPFFDVGWYNLACSLSLTGEVDGAIRALQMAIELGYDDEEWMQDDPDLTAVRRDPRFGGLVMLLRRLEAEDADDDDDYDDDDDGGEG